jgi:diaminohydroxyphosphoribosylaminopyrimidine deaminase/5-amino-6-(5-phosphoribosylamino)uracil reductase
MRDRLQAVAGERGVGLERAWSLLLALRHRARRPEPLPARFGLGLDEEGRSAIVPVADRSVLLEVAADGSWVAKAPITETGAEWFDLYLPMALGCRARPLTVAHLGQSLDGRIATLEGKSCYINGPENLTHLHRMRALCDAIVVGANTVECDDPQLTTRRVPGPNPVRVILDPRRRLAADCGVFRDRAAPTVVICDEALADQAGPDGAEIVGVPRRGRYLDLGAVLERLRARGLFGIFVEGGGLTVSAFLEQGLLDRLQIAVAPLIVGSGRPGITLPPIRDLSQGLRPRHRRYVMGEDVLFDCRLRDVADFPL